MVNFELYKTQAWQMHGINGTHLCEYGEIQTTKHITEDSTAYEGT